MHTHKQTHTHTQVVDAHTHTHAQKHIYRHTHKEGVSNWQGWTNMVQTYQDSREKGTTQPIPPQETEKIWHGSSDPQKVLQLHHGCITAW